MLTRLSYCPESETLTNFKISSRKMHLMIHEHVFLHLGAIPEPALKF